MRTPEDDEYMLRVIPGGAIARAHDTIYLFKKGDVNIHKEYYANTAVFKKIKPILDLMDGEKYFHVPGVLDYILTKDEFESVTGKRP